MALTNGYILLHVFVGDFFPLRFLTVTPFTTKGTYSISRHLKQSKKETEISKRLGNFWEFLRKTHNFWCGRVFQVHRESRFTKLFFFFCSFVCAVSVDLRMQVNSLHTFCKHIITHMV
eukprot:TRINITY_DN11974_c0_g1_i1.p1 TRINITY_DN11974_c0_g1~~TRINITY_DN11974_c0_g1_i1.p1  ORF type:complete len:118 (-),score=6.48 TRINITY_DN11974_c0_g1_i1:122-475(-)